MTESHSKFLEFYWKTIRERTEINLKAEEAVREFRNTQLLAISWVLAIVVGVFGNSLVSASLGFSGNVNMPLAIFSVSMLAIISVILFAYLPLDFEFTVGVTPFQDYFKFENERLAKIYQMDSPEMKELVLARIDKYGGRELWAPEDPGRELVLEFLARLKEMIENASRGDSSPLKVLRIRRVTVPPRINPYPDGLPYIELGYGFYVTFGLRKRFHSFHPRSSGAMIREARRLIRCLYETQLCFATNGFVTSKKELEDTDQVYKRALQENSYRGSCEILIDGILSIKAPKKPMYFEGDLVSPPPAESKL